MKFFILSFVLNNKLLKINIEKICKDKIKKKFVRQIDIYLKTQMCFEKPDIREKIIFHIFENLKCKKMCYNKTVFKTFFDPAMILSYYVNRRSCDIEFHLNFEISASAKGSRRVRKTLSDFSHFEQRNDR